MGGMLGALFGCCVVVFTCYDWFGTFLSYFYRSDVMPFECALYEQVVDGCDSLMSPYCTLKVDLH